MAPQFTEFPQDQTVFRAQQRKRKAAMKSLARILRSYVADAEEALRHARETKGDEYEELFEAIRRDRRSIQLITFVRIEDLLDANDKLFEDRKHFIEADRHQARLCRIRDAFLCKKSPGGLLRHDLAMSKDAYGLAKIAWYEHQRDALAARLLDAEDKFRRFLEIDRTVDEGFEYLASYHN